METITVVLGGKAFAVSQLAIRADAKWREIARPLVEPIAEMAMASGVANPTPERLVKLAFASALFVDPMATLNAVLAYAPALEAERDWIEEHAVAQEALAALLALFFGMGAPMSTPTGAAPAAPPTMSPN